MRSGRCSDICSGSEHDPVVRILCDPDRRCISCIPVCFSGGENGLPVLPVGPGDRIIHSLLTVSEAQRDHRSQFFTGLRHRAAVHGIDRRDLAIVFRVEDKRVAFAQTLVRTLLRHREHGYLVACFRTCFREEEVRHIVSIAVFDRPGNECVIRNILCHDRE